MRLAIVGVLVAGAVAAAAASVLRTQDTIWVRCGAKRGSVFRAPESASVHDGRSHRQWMLGRDCDRSSDPDDEIYVLRRHRLDDTLLEHLFPRHPPRNDEEFERMAHEDWLLPRGAARYLSADREAIAERQTWRMYRRAPR